MQVPYNPVPNAPNLIETPKVHVDSPVAAFGGTVGEALSSLGRTLGHAGDELFQRAIALQNLRNETEAKEADAQYMMEVGKLHANYSSLQGKAAVDALPKYQEDIQSLRQQMRGNLSNDMARRMFDGSSLSTSGRTIFNGAGHAATENKKWAVGASNARIGAIQDDIYRNPTDEVGVRRGLNAIDAELDGHEDLKGYSPEQVSEEKKKALSKATAHQITGLTNTEPFKAAQLLEANKSLLRGEDYVKVEHSVQTATRSTGARMIASEVNSDLNDPEKPGLPEVSLSYRIKSARAKAEKLNSGDKLL